MGKNQAHKAMQRSRYNGGGGGEEGVAPAFNDGLKDVTFHTAEWHAARIAALQVERMPWEEWRQKQKEAEGKLAAAAEEEERLMREYRAQLDADRTKLLARGRNHADLAKELKKDKKRKRKEGKLEKKGKKSKKDSKSKKKKSKKSKRRRTSSGDSSDSSSSAGSGSSSDSDGSNSEAEDNDSNKPMRLSDWLKM
ncbi:hypothetical protein VaNZ11_010067 [Volvox africanus]|uniref:CBF1-interacting co-repressor CIR N-terminal domain-containing protein n=1 Tax=Volvox africanus TaxID=51714 RepID=A0ABQ5SA47_9CHLO|nr:hypothetical protein VaNZ11_010067 [Volvox africanus]